MHLSSESSVHKILSFIPMSRAFSDAVGRRNKSFHDFEDAVAQYDLLIDSSAIDPEKLYRSPNCYSKITQEYFKYFISVQNSIEQECSSIRAIRGELELSEDGRPAGRVQEVQSGAFNASTFSFFSTYPYQNLYSIESVDVSQVMHCIDQR